VPSEFVGVNVLLIKPMVPGPAANVENTANNPGGPVGSILAEQEVIPLSKRKPSGFKE
jgi:hypothetical protein